MLEVINKINKTKYVFPLIRSVLENMYLMFLSKQLLVLSMKVWKSKPSNHVTLDDTWFGVEEKCGQLHWVIMSYL